ncbi:hypothetical protein E2C01_070471 [Portunus trituberculatus]|uniref:Uncharacterized protein n=1 Tax=Portunus trituberculatus TaxID=210409 RepID=A0A5B7HU87_PORTR|nr:hypothetical protein [Portunus trituberculatus]
MSSIAINTITITTTTIVITLINPNLTLKIQSILTPLHRLTISPSPPSPRPLQFREVTRSTSTQPCAVKVAAKPPPFYGATNTGPVRILRCSMTNNITNTAANPTQLYYPRLSLSLKRTLHYGTSSLQCKGNIT